MSEHIQDQVIETVVVPEEKRYEYQPTDDDGRPIGGKQVIKYTTSEELAEKLSEQNTLLLRKLRKETRNNRLGIFEKETIEDAAPRMREPIHFEKRVLSNEERYKLSQDILDPENFDKAVETVFEAAIGTSADVLTSTINDLQSESFALKIQREADKFSKDNPDYIICEENGQAIANWLARYNLAPVATNFQKAYNTLRDAGVLVTSLEIVRSTSPVVAPVVTEPPVLEEPARQEIPLESPAVVDPVVVPPVTPVVSRVPGALSRSNSSDAGVTPPTPGSDIVYEYIQRDGKGNQVGAPRVYTGLAAIDAMPSEEYKRRLLTEKGFAAKVEKLETEAAKKRSSR